MTSTREKVALWLSLAQVLDARLALASTGVAEGQAGIAATCHAVYLVAIKGGFDDVPGGAAMSG